MSFSDFAERSLGLNVLKSETNRLVALTDNKDRHKLPDEFALELVVKC